MIVAFLNSSGVVWTKNITSDAFYGRKLRFQIPTVKTFDTRISPNIFLITQVLSMCTNSSFVSKRIYYALPPAVHTNTTERKYQKGVYLKSLRPLKTELYNLSQLNGV